MVKMLGLFYSPLSTMETSMDITFANLHNGLQINADQDKGLGCITSMLDNYQTKLTYMISAHSKVMQVRFDLHYPDDGSVIPSRQHIYDFNYNLKRKLQRNKKTGGHPVDPKLLWTEEKSLSLNPHYHYILLVNGNTKNSYWTLLDEIISPLWKDTIKSTDNKGLVDYCDKGGPNGLMAIRSSPDFLNQLNQLSYQASYITKIKTKNNISKGNWLMGGSRTVPLSSVPMEILNLDLFG